MAPPTDNQAENSTSVKPRILIVDDSRLVRVKLANVLQDEFDIVEAEDGEEGWETLLADEKIQVALTDAGMPKLDGYGLIERIRAHGEKRVQEVPIIMITAADDEESRQKALGIGATDFITKPFEKSQLIARVRAQVKLDQTTRDLAENATDDPLTGLRSRRYFLMRGQQDLAFTSRHNQDLSVFVLAIDQFEKIEAANYGNKVISAIATMLKAAIRTEDTLARTGKTQFGIIAPTLAWAQAEQVCNRIREKISSSSIPIDNQKMPLSVSIGLVNLGVDNAETIEDYLKLAEQYVAQAQAAGGNNLVATKKKEAPKKKVSLDATSRIMETGNTDRLTPHLKTIAAQILPLLELCNKKLGWRMEEAIQTMKDKLES